MSTQKFQSKIIFKERAKSLMLIYLQEFQEILSVCYGLNGNTIARFQYDTEAQIPPKVTTTNDGYAIIQGLNFAQVNPVKEKIRVLLLETARRVNLLVGDGTTTAMLLTIALCKDVILDRNISIDDIDNFQEYLLEFIKENTYLEVGKEELYNYAKIATRSDKLAKEIANLVHKLPKGIRPTIDKDFIGMEKENKYSIFENSFYLSSSIKSHNFFDKNQFGTTLFEANLTDCYVASTLQAVNWTGLNENMLSELANIFCVKYSSRKKDYNLLLICSEMDDNMERWCYDFNILVSQMLTDSGIEVNHKFRLVPIIVGKGGLSANHDYNKAIYEDFKALMNCKTFNNHQGETIKNITYKDLGFVEKVTIGLKTTTFKTPRSNANLLREQQKKVLGILHNTEEISSNQMLQEFMARRARLALSYASVQVGATTESERHNKFKKLEDGIYGCCTIKETGYVAGANTLLIAGLQTYNAIRTQKGEPILHLEGMFMPTLLLCENSNDPDTNLNLLDNLLYIDDEDLEEDDYIECQDFDYTDILNGYTIDMAKNEFSHCNKSGIIDASQMLIEIINSTFSTVREVAGIGMIEITEEVSCSIDYDKEVEIVEEEEILVTETDIIKYLKRL